MLETVWRLRDEDKQIGYARENRNIVRWCRTQASSSHSWQGVVDDRNNEAGVSTTAPGRSAAHDVDDRSFLASQVFRGANNKKVRFFVL